MLEVFWTAQAKNDYDYWAKQRPKIAKRINNLISSISKDPFRGLGKPEPLKHDLQGFWSRRISRGHRLVYEVSDGVIMIYSCSDHY